MIISDEINDILVENKIQTDITSKQDLVREHFHVLIIVQYKIFWIALKRFTI